MRNTDKDYLDQITGGDEAKPDSSPRNAKEESKKTADKGKVRLETRRRLEDILESKRLYAELDDYI